MNSGRLSESKQLREVSVTQWAQQAAGLSEVRDQREVLTLASVRDHINADDLATAMDILSQRISAVQRAKTAGGDWKKAEALELVMGTGSMAPGGMLKLGQ
jgi:hypothetical protein